VLRNPKIPCVVGLRKSQSKTNVFLPACANTTPKLAQTLLLPSPKPGLVIKSTLDDFPTSLCKRLARM
jgi:hypothetical protein